jgi:hypothetical protein
MLSDIYHRVDEDFLENYLNEYSYRLNRRYFGCLMDRALMAAVDVKWNFFG